MRAFLLALALAACSSSTASSASKPDAAAGSAGSAQDAAAGASGAVVDGSAGGAGAAGTAGAPGGSGGLAGAAGSAGSPGTGGTAGSTGGAGGIAGASGSSGTAGAAGAAPYTYCFNVSEKWGDCDRDASTSGPSTPGCETNVETSEQNCGACARACPGAMTCEYGACTCVKSTDCGPVGTGNCLGGVCQCRPSMGVPWTTCAEEQICSASGACE